MKRHFTLRRTGAFLIVSSLLAVTAPAFAGDESLPVCPAAMNKHSTMECVIGLQNDTFEVRPRGAANTDLVWQAVPGWAISAPAPIHPIWQGQRYIGTAVGVAPGASMSQTVRATRLDSGMGAPIPTYRVVFDASSFGAASGSALIARLIGIGGNGVETELGSLKVSPNGDGLQEYTFNAHPQGQNPDSLRLEFVRKGGSRPIFVGGAGIVQSFNHRR
jgi:hypothetical protein